MLACCVAALSAAACEEAQSVEIQSLPPVERPSPEARAGLPEVEGTWRFAGFEIAAEDTAALNAGVYEMTPPGVFRFLAQRLDSIAGQYVRDGVAFPFAGEVRRDGVVALVANDPGGVGRFVAGRLVRDTLWIELTSFPSAAGWPSGTRAALVRGPVGEPFTRLLGGAPIVVPVDTAALDTAAAVDSVVVAPTPPVVEPAPAAPPPERPTPAPPAARPPVRRPPEARPQPPAPEQPRPARPPREEPRREEPRREEPPARPPRPEPEEPVRPPRPEPVEPEPVLPDPEPVIPEPVAPEPIDPRPAPRDTIRLGVPPR